MNQPLLHFVIFLMWTKIWLYWVFGYNICLSSSDSFLGKKINFFFATLYLCWCVLMHSQIKCCNFAIEIKMQFIEASFSVKPLNLVKIRRMRASGLNVFQKGLARYLNDSQICVRSIATSRVYCQSSGNTSSPQTEGGGSSEAKQETLEQEQQQQAGGPKLLVFGGNGFVGSRVCQEAINMGMGVVSINRSGRPKNISENWIENVDWVAGDAFDVTTYQSQLSGCTAAISTVGAFGSNDFMLKINGQANINAINAAKEAGVPRFVFVGVHEYGFPDFVLNGYFQGKKNAENCLKEVYGDQGVTLKPGFVSGSRRVGAVTLPLEYVGNPLQKILGYFPTKNISKVPLVGAGFVPPVSVECLAKAAVMAALDPQFGRSTLDVWEIEEFK
eukprot:TRINITY_DN2863_c0_g2_i1.p1 TRINITY_DN2863_c0_g2~~TRINITY_DN2863_c0_g2_i1.p1  ORF type:complete len:387 (-),score=47.15 TRINITY_DN2863_c0_g2_i1:165-1325(-)